MLKLVCEGAGAVPSPVIASETETWRDNAGAVCAYGQVVGEEYWMHMPGCASFRFSARTTDVTAVVASGVSHELVLDTYRRTVLPIALQVRGREVLHASAVRTSRGVLALCGISETGKSTIAFGLSRRGYGLWADDAVAFEVVGTGAVNSISLPFRILLRPPAAELFCVRATRPSTHTHKDVEPLWACSSPLLAVCVLRRGVHTACGAGISPFVAVRRLSSAEALVAVLPHAHCFTLRDSERKREMMQHYLELVARIPIFDVRFPTGLANLPAVLDALECHVVESPMME